MERNTLIFQLQCDSMIFWNQYSMMLWNVLWKTVDGLNPANHTQNV